MQKSFERFSAFERHVCAVIALGTLASVLLSYRLWGSNRLYALVPILESLASFSESLAAIPLYTLSALLLYLIFAGPARKALTLYVVAGVLFGLLDQNRFQPWFYQSLLFSIALSARSGRRELCTLIISGTYLWSGIQKINFSFVSGIFPWMMNPFIDILAAVSWMAPAALVSPFVEIAIGLMLLSPKSRPLGGFFAILMHLAILTSIGPFGHNWNHVVWPWNIEMCLLAYFLFLARNMAETATALLSLDRLRTCVIVLLVWLMPALSFFGLWDAYLSFALYSGNTVEASLSVEGKNTKSLLEWLTKKEQNEAAQSVNLDLMRWSLDELGVPSYPAQRVLKAVATSVCARFEDPSGVVLTIKERPDIRTGEREMHYLTCAALAAE